MLPLAAALLAPEALELLGAGIAGFLGYKLLTKDKEIPDFTNLLDNNDGVFPDGNDLAINNDITTTKPLELDLSYFDNLSEIASQTSSKTLENSTEIINDVKDVDNSLSDENNLLQKLENSNNVNSRLLSGLLNTSLQNSLVLSATMPVIAGSIKAFSEAFVSLVNSDLYQDSLAKNMAVSVEAPNVNVENNIPINTLVTALNQLFAKTKEKDEALIDELTFRKTATSVKDLDGNVLTKVSPRELETIKNVSVAKEKTDINNFELEQDDYDIIDLSGIDLSDLFEFKGAYTFDNEIFNQGG